MYAATIPSNPRESRAGSVFAALIGLSVVFVNPLYGSLVFAHVMMIFCVGAWLLLRSPKSMFIAVSTAILFIAYLLVLSELVHRGDRFVNESAKYALLLVCIPAMMDFSSVARKALYWMAFVIPALLFLYVVLSPDPFVYGGRLGISLADGGEDAMISANTIGFAVNICVATLLGRKSRFFYYLAPLFLVLLYFTLSRGAILSLGAIGIAYFIRARRLIYVAILGLPCLFLLLDANSGLALAFRLDDATGSGRTILYQMMFDEMMANPITFLIGNGPGNVNFEIYTGKIIVSAHNGYLEMFYTFGAFGFAAVMYFLTKVARNFRALPLDSLLYAVLLASYASSEDLMGAHNLMISALILGVVLNDFRRLRRARVAGSAPRFYSPPALMDARIRT